MNRTGLSTFGGVGALASGAFIAMFPLVLVKCAATGEHCDMAFISFAFALLIAGPWLAGACSAAIAWVENQRRIILLFALGSALPALGASLAAVDQGRSTAVSLLLLAAFHAGFSLTLGFAALWIRAARVHGSD